MKPYLSVLLSLVFVSIIISCSEKEQPVTGIAYPQNGLYGANVLDSTRTDYLNTSGSQKSVSLAATIPAGSTIKVEFNAIALQSSLPDTGKAQPPVWSDYGMPAFQTDPGWQFNMFDIKTGKQIFQTTESGRTNDLQVLLVNHGSITLKIFENGSTSLTRQKTITW